MRRIKLIVAYDGTNYSGWQLQPNKETIEGVLNRELSAFLNEEIKVIGASRTDSGVHAKGAVCVFDTNSTIPPEKFSYAINRFLPEDISIRHSEEVAGDFHPRKVPTRKTYCYSIWHDDFDNPLKTRYAHFVYTKLNVENMRKACEYIKGKHDFKAFCSAHADVESTVRTIYDIHIDVENEKSMMNLQGLTKNTPVSEGKMPEMINIYVTGNGFLYNMVRIIAGTLINVGQGKIKPEEIEDILEKCDRTRAGVTAPAKGLTLMGYVFPKK